MLRVFSHYVSARFLLLAALEGAVLALAVNWGIALEASSVASMTPVEDASIVLVTVTFPAVMLFVMNGIGLYEPELMKQRRSVAMRLGVATVAALAITCALLAIMPSPQLPPPRGLLLGALAGLLLNCMIRWLLSLWSGALYFKRRVLVLGSGSGAARIALHAQRERSHEVVGCIHCGPTGESVAPLPRLLPASRESLSDVAERYCVDDIVIAIKDRRGGGLPVQDLLACRLRGVRVSDLSTFFEREHRQVLLESLTPSWMVFGEGFRRGLARAIVKRAFDIVVSFALLVVTLPVVLVAAACILIESGRPVLYRQERVGQGGRTFTICKFRSMRTGAEGDGKPRWAAANDERTTRFGRFMRKTRIDELPQIINVLKGDMTFVGPRPERPYFVEKLSEQIPYYNLRHTVKPGITGWAQVRYSYGASVDDAIEKLQYDLYYVKNHTLFLDLVILLNTVEVVLWGSGSGAQPDSNAAVARARSSLTAASMESATARSALSQVVEP